MKSFFTKGNAEKRRRQVEATATFGLILICVALAAPFAAPENVGLMSVFKWIYAAGTLIFLIARAVGAGDPSDSLRMRRLRRMEFWAGVAFLAGAAFWFYQEVHLGPYTGMLALLRDTIMFTLAGAVIQVIASWMIVARGKKERGETNVK